MPQYEKKRPRRKPARRPVRETTDRIEMSASRRDKKPARTEPSTADRPRAKKTAPKQNRPTPPARRQSEPLRVVTGRKLVRRKKALATAVVALLLVGGLWMLSASTPTGLLDALRGKIASFGSGDMPANLSGGESRDAYLVSGNAFLLSDTHAEIYNPAGKQIFSRQHAFAFPVLRTSAARAAVYDQNGTDFYLFSLTGVLAERKFETPILCAAVARDGSYAVATRSKSYASQVEVFNRRGKAVFTWYSPTDLIVDVALSDDGKQLAVAAVTVQNGSVHSRVSLFDYRSATAHDTVDYAGEAVYRLQTVSSGRFAVVCARRVDILAFRDAQRTEHKTDYEVSCFRTDGNSWSAAALGREGNKNDNRILVCGAAGESKADFSFQGAVTDLTVRQDTIYILSDGTVYTLDFSGAVQRSAPCSFHASRILCYAENAILEISDQTMAQVKLPVPEQTEVSS